MQSDCGLHHMPVPCAFLLHYTGIRLYLILVHPFMEQWVGSTSCPKSPFQRTPKEADVLFGPRSGNIVIVIHHMQIIETAIRKQHCFIIFSEHHKARGTHSSGASPSWFPQQPSQHSQIRPQSARNWPPPGGSFFEPDSNYLPGL